MLAFSFPLSLSWSISESFKNAVRCGFGAQSAGPSPYCASLNVLSILAEFGDFNPVEHDEAFVSEFRFHPKQDEHMEMSILG